MNPTGCQHPRRIILRGRERRALARIVRSHKSEQRMVLRARIVLCAGLGQNSSAIAHDLGVHVRTVRKWRARFADDRLEGLDDAERPGRPETFNGLHRHELFTLLVSEPPHPFARWTLDLLVAGLIERGIVPAISRETISTWMRTAELKPHRTRYWLTSKDPDFRVKRDRVIDLYLNPPKDGVVLSIDEKTSIQALERKYPDLPARPGKYHRRLEFEYIRHGTVNLLAAMDVRTGKVVGECVDRNDSPAFIGFLRALMRRFRGKRMYLVLDNGTTHRSKETVKFLARHPRLVPVYLPTHASWLNQIELWFSVLGRQALHKVSFGSRIALQERIEAYIQVHNAKLAHPYSWTSKGRPLTSGKKWCHRTVKALLRRAEGRARV